MRLSFGPLAAQYWVISEARALVFKKIERKWRDGAPHRGTHLREDPLALQESIDALFIDKCS